jgi:short-subunit dehydrogenase
MALGTTFWMSSVKKASKQILSAIKHKKRRVYITKRWSLVALILKVVPTSLLYKFS